MEKPKLASFAKQSDAVASLAKQTGFKLLPIDFDTASPTQPKPQSSGTFLFRRLRGIEAI